jgi:CO/xanthine dehydrogenase Mo-binding subunit
LEGCATFGLGQALFEEMIYGDHGQLLNTNLGEYNVPSFDDVPVQISPIAVENPGSEDLHGIGETLLPPVMAAIGNAVYNAVGVRIHDLPLTAEKLLRGYITRRPNALFPLPLGEGEGEGQNQEKKT